MALERYFSTSGLKTELILHKNFQLQGRINELVPFHYSCLLISSMREEIARKGSDVPTIGNRHNDLVCLYFSYEFVLYDACWH